MPGVDQADRWWAGLAASWGASLQLELRPLASNAFLDVLDDQIRDRPPERSLDELARTDAQLARGTVQRLRDLARQCDLDPRQAPRTPERINIGHVSMVTVQDLATPARGARVILGPIDKNQGLDRPESAPHPLRGKLWKRPTQALLEDGARRARGRHGLVVEDAPKVPVDRRREPGPA